MNKMEKKLKLYKKMSETPLECIQRWQKENPEYLDEKMTYAGRLDPMAEGELLVLVGEECKNKEKYLGLDKEYEVNILFGFETDTHDVLGLTINHLASGALRDYDIIGHKGKIERFLEKLIGKQKQEYPFFSSKTIDGKQLFQITKDGELDSKKIPQREIEIYEAELLKNYYMLGRCLKANIMKRILLVTGDFRQEEILEKWNKELSGREEEQFLVVKIRVKCSGGTYMRSIAHNLGKFLSVPSLALKIKRTKIFSDF